MKTLLSFAVALLSGLGVQAQTNATILFANDTNSLVSNSLTGMLVKSNDLIRVLLYVGPDGSTDEASFIRLPTSVPVGIPAFGRYSGGTRVLPPPASPGGGHMIQVRAFETTYGNTYEEAIAAPPMNGRRALVGKSAIARVVATSPPDPPPSTRVVGPFSVNVAGAEGPYLAVNDIVVAEGSNGVFNAQFTVRLMTAQTEPVLVDFLTADGTALAGQDYVATNGTLTFAAGETTKTVGIVLTADATPEPDETFYLQLRNPINAAIVRGLASCLITEVRITGLSVDTSVSFNTVASRRYVVEKSSDALSWLPVAGATNILGNGSIMTILDRGSGCSAVMIYRARLLEL